MPSLSETILQIFADQRRNIPSCNRRLFDIATNDFYPQLISARDTPEFQEISARLWAHIQTLQNPENSELPALLCRHESETISEYLDRCYAATAPAETENRFTKPETEKEKE